MTALNKRAAAGYLRLFATMSGLLFLPAWSFHYWQAWIFLAVFFLSTLAITIYLARNDPALLERRTDAGPRAEQQRKQKTIQSFAAVAFVAVIGFPAVDHRFKWSTVPPVLSVAGDGLVAVGLLLVFLVFRVNTFTSATIQVWEAQQVKTTGPYALVRHPMYAGALVMLLGVPLALGSWWGLFMVVPISLVIVWRLLEEERFLTQNLANYSDYRNRVKYRLVPFVW